MCLKKIEKGNQGFLGNFPFPTIIRHFRFCEIALIKNWSQKHLEYDEARELSETKTGTKFHASLLNITKFLSSFFSKNAIQSLGKSIYNCKL